MFAATVLNYMDRQAIAMVGPHIRRSFQISYEGFGWVISAFSLAYALFQVPAGYLVDRWDVRRVYAGAVVWWSLAAIGVAFSPVIGALIAFRALLGVGESFNWPCALRVTGMILPPADRSLGNGIFNSGAAVGAVAAPLAIPLLTQFAGWQTAFLVVGSLGFVWVVAWLAVFRGDRSWTAFSSPAAEDHPDSSAEGTTRRLSRPAQLAFGGLVLGAVLIGVVGYEWGVPVAEPLAGLEPHQPQPVRLIRWLVRPGESVARNAPLAEVELGGATFWIRARDEGKVVRLDQSEGEEVAAGRRLLVLDDGAARMDVLLTGLEPRQAGRVLRWHVELGDRIRRGDPLATIRIDGVDLIQRAAHTGAVLRFDVGQGDTIAPDHRVLTTEVWGFDLKGFGLSAIWLAIAFLMVGLLVIALLLPQRTLQGADWAASLGQVVRLRRFWVMVVVSISVNVCWHFLVTWLPTYLNSDRGMTYLKSGLISALPFLAADAGNLGGGALSRFLARRGLSPYQARIRVIALCAVLISCGAGVGAVRSDTWILVLLAVMALGAAAYMANYFAFTQEVDPRLTGLIVGLLGGLGNLFAAGFHPLAGKIKDATGGFGLVFLIVGVAPLVGVGSLLVGWGPQDEDAAAKAS